MFAAATLSGETRNEEIKESSAEKKKKEKKKTHWHTKQRHEESDQQSILVKDSLKKYKEDLTAFDSVASRFDTFATAMAKEKDANGVRRKAMTFTDFLHSLVLPRFRLSHPPRTAQYTCPFVGDADGLISYEECHLLYHLLEIPVEHFDVAFHMFDLDGNGTVDKAEFLEVLSSVLNNIKDLRTSTSEKSTKDDDDAVHVEASYHLLLHFFGKSGKKKITGREFVAVVQALKEALLRAEFDMYATSPSATTKFREFHSVIQNHLADIRLAFELQRGGDEITEGIYDFIKAAYIVSGVRLPAHIVSMAFRVFDLDGNGSLDHEEVLRVRQT
ncbi:hypothetical protein B5M09_004096 [Aphanomyces astaci]|uniref:EF-hand domain-containing protein n=1 Tax=Aphanomyces astaci TaxID=112090 RepID=A0A425D9W5_APHAT|nr:hypothetical protein B5M09_004096 [Aphanomyces astaci]